MMSVKQDAITTFAEAHAVYQRGDKDAARTACGILLSINPQEVSAWLLLGAINRDLGFVYEAEACWWRAAQLEPVRHEALLNLAGMYRTQRRWRDAMNCYVQTTQRNSTVAAAWLGWCETLLELGQYAEAINLVESARVAGCVTYDLLLCQGNAYFQSGHPAQAAQCYQSLVQQNPSVKPPRYNLALALAKAGRRAESVSVLQALIGMAPEYLNAHIKLADLLADAGDPRGAAVAYRAAIALRPDMGELHNNLGKALRQIGQMPEARACFETAIRLGIQQAVVYLNLGGVYQSLRQQDEALAIYRQGLAIDPDDYSLLTSAVHVQQMLCDWNGLENLHERLVTPALQEVVGRLPPPSFPFLALPTLVTSAEQRCIADNYARSLTDTASTVYAHTPQLRGAKPLRIGYVSADFHNHATAHLMLGLFKRHDRSQVEVWAYSLGSDDGSYYRKRIAADCDHFQDIGSLSDDQAAARIHADAIDIVIDLKGYTGSARPAIFARRPAPLQVQYLGYPGTMGGDFIDYVIADQVVLPPADIPFYSESPIWMPHCYQINDCEQPIAAHLPDRATCGLPEQGFVFCCFNSPYKIEPKVFDAWMQMLAAVPDSVLWLYAGNPTAVINRRQAAVNWGIAPERLVFAEMMPKDRHLARQRQADLFLDTLFYNAHTTGSDALWAGVPMLTLPGETFASRVGESLLRAVGLEEMIVPSLDAYVAKAIEFAQHPERLAAIKAKLAQNRLTCSLFDTEAFTRGLEYAYSAIWSRWESDMPPAPITVPEKI